MECPRAAIRCPVSRSQYRVSVVSSLGLYGGLYGELKGRKVVTPASAPMSRSVAPAVPGGRARRWAGAMALLQAGSGGR